MKARGPIIIGLAGLAGTGKDTAAAYLRRAHAFERYAFAAPLRDMLEALLATLGRPQDYLHDPKLKEQPIPGLGLSYRVLAQTLGTEWARVHLGADFWLRAADLALGLPEAPVHDRIVISDVRFANEAEWIRQRGGVVVRMDRPTAAPVREHISEQQVQAIEAWTVVDNSGDMAWLQWQLDAIVERLATCEL